MQGVMMYPGALRTRVHNVRVNRNSSNGPSSGHSNHNITKGGRLTSKELRIQDNISLEEPWS